MFKKSEQYYKKRKKEPMPTLKVNNQSIFNENKLDVSLKTPRLSTMNTFDSGK